MLSTASPPQALEAAIVKLHTVCDTSLTTPSHIVNPSVIAAAARAVTRAADEAELSALETSDRPQRAQLLYRVARARTAAKNARETARQHSLARSRDALFMPPGAAVAVAAATGAFGAAPGNAGNDARAGGGMGTVSGVNAEQGGDRLHGASNPVAGGLPPNLRQTLLSSPPGATRRPASQTESLAHDINDALRRTSAVVADEVARSRAAGSIVDLSTQRLRSTRDQHGMTQGALRRGGKTLRHLRTSEALANVVVILSFGIFFVVAGYVASRRLRSSIVASVIIRPAAKVAFAPVDIVLRTVKRIGRRSSEMNAGDPRGGGVAGKEGMAKSGSATVDDTMEETVDDDVARSAKVRGGSPYAATVQQTANHDDSEL